MFAPFYVFFLTKKKKIKKSKSGIGKKKKIMQCLCILNLCLYLLYQPQTYKFTQQF